MSRARAWTAIVPTLGRSPWLEACLEALRRDGGEQVEVVVVDQGEEPSRAAERLADRVLRLERNRGFAAANNLALETVETAFVATVNDDAVIAPGWSRALIAALEERPGAAAAQGVQVQVGGTAGERPIDGAGLAWNRRWQAVQLARGRDLESWRREVGAGPIEIFGVSATAALYRREALHRAALADGSVFDPVLVSYYEDVDLACRLRRLGYEAVLVPSASAEHAGSTTGRQLPYAGYELIYSNRYLALARYLGRGFWPRLPAIWLRDAADLWQARGDRMRRRAIPRAWWRAAGRLRRFAHLSPAPIPLTARFSGDLE